MRDETEEQGTAVLVLKDLEDQAVTFRRHSEGTGAEEGVEAGEYHQQMHVSRRAFLQLVSVNYRAPGSGMTK